MPSFTCLSSMTVWMASLDTSSAIKINKKIFAFAEYMMIWANHIDILIPLQDFYSMMHMTFYSVALWAM